MTEVMENDQFGTRKWIARREAPAAGGEQDTKFSWKL
jgi:hypothetical protein